MNLSEMTPEQKETFRKMVELRRDMRYEMESHAIRITYLNKEEAELQKGCEHPEAFLINVSANSSEKNVCSLCNYVFIRK